MELLALQPYRDHFEHLHDICLLCDLQLKSFYEHFSPDVQSDIRTLLLHMENRIRLSGNDLPPCLSVSGILQPDTAEDVLALKKRLVCYLSSPETVWERPWFSLMRPDDLLPSDTLNSGLMDTLATLLVYPSCLDEPSGTSRVVWFHGPSGTGRKFHLCHAAASHGLSLLIVSLDTLLSGDSFASLLREVVLESLLMNAVLCFDHAEALFSQDEGRQAALFFHFTKKLRLVFCVSKEPIHTENDTSFYFTEVSMPLPDPEQREKIWSHFCTPYVLSEDVFLPELARLVLTPLQIRQSVQVACALALADPKTADRLAPCLQKSHLLPAIRRFSAPNLGSLGQLTEASFRWDDLILPDEAKKNLLAILTRVSFADMVYRKWGFMQKFPYGRGVSVLFAGPPGTGKTMAAQVLAGELGLSLYRINLAAIVSKYIGETEKNLQNVFDQAQNTNCILFFDEADSLFTKRTEVKDAHDRHANLEVTYLLQKLEEYEGITILATNLLKNFDDAFKRRFQYVIDFPFPDEKSRKKIWQSVFPAKTPLADNLDFASLASCFKLSGSSIKNIALAAAFEAAASAQAISIHHIIAALKEESARLGVPLLDEELGEYGVLGTIKT